MKTFRTALKCLTQPTTLIAVAVLLINDHFLKAAMPSWLTGKLSDFAGLCFFPFLLAIALAPIRLNERVTGFVAALITGFWFTLIKTSPEVSALTEQLVSILTRSPSQIVLDKTDLMALVSLWPAWMLWKQICDEAALPSLPPRRLEWLMLGVASLATMATTCAPIPKIDHVVEHEGALYALHGWYESYVFSTDAGWNWRDTQDVPPNVVEKLESNQWTEQLCDPLQPSVCYRLTGLPRIEQSLDAGKTWHVSWQLPDGREDFMRRYLAPVIAFQVCPPDYVTTTPNSLAFVTYEGESYLIAAMQTEGILRHTPTGSWERLNVVDADPTPYTASNNSQAFILMLHEALNWLGGALLTVWLIRAWQMQAVLTQSHSRRICFWVIARLVIAIVLLLGWLIFTITFSGAAEVGYLWPAFFVGLPILGLVAVNSGFWPLLGVLGILIAIAFVIRLWLNIDWPKIDKRPLGATIIIAVTILLVGYAPFPFWAQGIIAEYNVARYIALGATVIVWLAGGFWIKRLIVPTQQ